MKKIYTLVLLAVSCLAFAQQSFNPEFGYPDLQKLEKQKPIGHVSLKVPTTQTTQQVVLRYDSLDRAAGIIPGYTDKTYFWDMNIHNAKTTSTVTPTTGWYNYVVVAYDSLWNIDGNLVPKTSIERITVDSLDFSFGYNNVTGIADSLIIKVCAVDGAGYPNVNAVYAADTLYGSDGGGNFIDFAPGGTYLSWQIQAMRSRIGYTVVGKSFALKFEYHGDLQDTFHMEADFQFEGFCSLHPTWHVVKPSVYPYQVMGYGNSFTWNTYNNKLLPTNAGSDIWIDCDNSASRNVGDGVWYTQNWVVQTYVTVDDQLGLPDMQRGGIGLSQNVPNPFNGSTTVSYSIKEKDNVMLTVYDITGKQVMQFNEGNKSAGKYSVKIDGTKLAKGLYYYSLTSGDKTSAVKKMIITE